MNDHKNERLSAYIDGEFNDEDFGIVDDLLGNDDMKDTWMRYHLIGDCMRDHLPQEISNQVAGDVSRALQDEPQILAPERSGRISFKPVVGFAIAASVAMFVVLGIQKGNQYDAPVQPASVAKQEVAPIYSRPEVNQFNNSRVLPVGVRKSDIPGSFASQRLGNYLMNHNEYRTGTSINGILPYVRVVTIGSQE